MAIDVPVGRVVTRRRFGASWRRRRIVFAAGTGPVSDLAGLGRLQQGEAKFPIGGAQLLSLCRKLRNSAFGRIDNHRRARAGVLPGYEQLVVGAADVEFGPALRALVLPGECRAHLIQFGSLRLGEELLVRVLGGRCKGVSDSSVQIPCRSGSPHGVFSAEAISAVAEAAGA